MHLPVQSAVSNGSGPSYPAWQEHTPAAQSVLAPHAGAEDPRHTSEIYTYISINLCRMNKTQKRPS